MINELTEKFIRACVLKGESEECGDHKLGNKQYKIINSVYLLLKENNSLEELIKLLDHDNPYVRLWAAGYTLQISPDESEGTLEALSGTKGSMIGHNAKMILQEWRAGRLKF